MSKLFPSKKEWKSWDLLHRMGYCGFWIGVISLVVGLLFGFYSLIPPKVQDIYCTRESPTEDCPLDIDAYSYKLTHPEGSEIDGIIWRNRYVDVRVLLSNNGPESIQNMSLILDPETHVRKAVQATNHPNVSISPDTGSVKELAVVIQKDDGTRNIIPAPTTGDYIVPRVIVQCPNLLGNGGEIKIVMACVALNPAAKGKMPKKLMAPRRPPKWIRISGTYETIEAGSHKRFHFKDNFPLIK